MEDITVLCCVRIDVVYITFVERWPIFTAVELYQSGITITDIAGYHHHICYVRARCVITHYGL